MSRLNTIGVLAARLTGPWSRKYFVAHACEPAPSLSPVHAIGVRWKSYDDNIRAVDVVAFIRHLDAQLRRPLVVVLDRFNVHRSAIRQLLERRTPWLDIERLPAYAPT
ncbi:MAG: hypothetical protein C0483_11295 [Pirellula sp.]|nr:hypothetical protein [Pirellula sp.]